MPDDDITKVDLLHQPAVGMFMIGLLLGGLFMLVVNLRNARLWLLLLRGRRANGTVEAMEIATGTNEVLRRPRVAYTTAAGEPVVATPAVYRKKSRLQAGHRVRLSYAPGNPGRIAVHGFDFRPSEPVWATAGVVLAATVATLYF
jgi:hypothetical protein